MTYSCYFVGHIKSSPFQLVRRCIYYLANTCEIAVMNNSLSCLQMVVIFQFSKYWPDKIKKMSGQTPEACQDYSLIQLDKQIGCQCPTQKYGWPAQMWCTWVLYMNTVEIRLSESAGTREHCSEAERILKGPGLSVRGLCLSKRGLGLSVRGQGLFVRETNLLFRGPTFL